MVTSSISFKIKKVEHTGITVTSLHDALEFWVGVLGFKHLYTTRFPNDPFIENVVGVSGAAMTLAMVEGPGHSIELLEYSAPDNRNILKPRSCDVGSVHVAFLVNNLDALLDRITALFVWMSRFVAAIFPLTLSLSPCGRGNPRTTSSHKCKPL